MSRYEEIMDRISLSDEARERILYKTEKAADRYGDKPIARSSLMRRKYLAAAACIALIAAGAVSLYRAPAKAPGEGGVRMEEKVSAEEENASDQNSYAAGEAADEENENVYKDEAGDPGGHALFWHIGTVLPRTMVKNGILISAGAYDIYQEIID